MSEADAAEAAFFHSARILEKLVLQKNAECFRVASSLEDVRFSISKWFPNYSWAQDIINSRGFDSSAFQSAIHTTSDPLTFIPFNGVAQDGQPKARTHDPAQMRNPRKGNRNAFHHSKVLVDKVVHTADVSRDKVALMKRQRQQNGDASVAPSSSVPLTEERDAFLTDAYKAVCADAKIVCARLYALHPLIMQKEISDRNIQQQQEQNTIINDENTTPRRSLVCPSRALLLVATPRDREARRKGESVSSIECHATNTNPKGLCYRFWQAENGVPSSQHSSQNDLV